MLNPSIIFILFASIFINACATVTKEPVQSEIERVDNQIIVEKNPTIKNPTIIVASIEKNNEHHTINNVHKKSSSKKNPQRQAVLELLIQSQSAIEQEDYQNAESLLKRALRIEPSNAHLWHNMAIIKFYQGDYQQAKQQALKSNNLDQNDPQLKLNNQKIIELSNRELLP